MFFNYERNIQFILDNLLNTRYISIIIIDLKGFACKDSIKLRGVNIDTEVGLFLDRTYSGYVISFSVIELRFGWYFCVICLVGVFLT